MSRLKSILRASVLSGFAAAMIGSCSAPFDPPGLVNSVRVLGVEIDKPYAQPGDAVTFTMHYTDRRDQEVVSPTLIAWIGGCWNPPGNQYFGCYEDLAEAFAGLQAGGPLPEGLVSVGIDLTSFTVTVPNDVLAEVGEPDAGPRVALGFVFFVVCDGTLGFVDDPEGETEAGDFPIACFDAEGRQLGPEGFVPGYTQIYVFEDGRTNANPVVSGMEFDGELLALEATPSAPACEVTLEERRESGCAAIDEFTECDTVTLDVVVPDDVAEVDPDAFDIDGDPVNEVVWVSWFSDGGSFESEVKLVSDAREGINKERKTKWVPPDVPGPYVIWAVVRDNRGGSRVLTQNVTVTE